MFTCACARLNNEVGPSPKYNAKSLRLRAIDVVLINVKIIPEI
jgi:hypothetical protein